MSAFTRNQLRAFALAIAVFLSVISTPNARADSPLLTPTASPAPMPSETIREIPPTTDANYQFPEPDLSLLKLLVHDDIAYPDSYWMQLSVGGTLFDVRTQNWSPRWSPSLQAGKRYGRFGVFGNLGLDETFDLTQEIKVLNVLHLGVGVEQVSLLGRLRTSASIGLAVLESDTDIDTRGKIGWYAEFRPASVRWGPHFGGILELSPLGINISVPVTHGIPLVLFAYFTTFSYEWNFGT